MPDENGVQTLTELLPGATWTRVQLPPQTGIERVSEGMSGHAAEQQPLTDADRPTQPAPAFFLELSTDDAKPFQRTSTVEIWIKGQVRTLAIHSVDVETIQPVIEQLRPKAPRTRDRNGQYVTDDTQLGQLYPKYAKALHRFNFQVGLAYILLGTEGLQLREGQEVVWAADGSVRNTMKAIEALEKMGLSNAQWVGWYNAIVGLSTVRQQEDEAALLGESDAS